MTIPQEHFSVFPEVIVSCGHSIIKICNFSFWELCYKWKIYLSSSVFSALIAPSLLVVMRIAFDDYSDGILLLPRHWHEHFHAFMSSFFFGSLTAGLHWLDISVQSRSDESCPKCGGIFTVSTKDPGVTVNTEIKSHESQHSCLLKKRRNSNEFFHFAATW